jgi:Skp family chaperone for outer membrane proteins
VLSPDAYEAKRREFEKKVVDVQRRVQDRSRQLEQTFGGARNDVGKTMRKIVSDLAGERGFNVVLEVAQLNYSAPDLDITAEVLKRLDQQMPTVKLALPPG